VAAASLLCALAATNVSAERVRNSAIRQTADYGAARVTTVIASAPFSLLLAGLGWPNVWR